MYPSPCQRTIPSNHTPPLSMATQPPLFITFDLIFQTHITIPSFHPYTVNVPTYNPHSSPNQNFDGSDYGYQPEHFISGINPYSPSTWS